MILEHITENQRKRTLKLLQDTKNYVGIDGYILMKKILAVGIITDYYQNKYNIYRWINYEQLLTRNENLIKQKSNIPFIKMKNGLIHNYFFGIKSYTVINGMQINVEMEMYDYWEKVIKSKK